MKRALEFVVVAFALGLIAVALAYLAVSSSRLQDAISAGLLAGLPFFGVAVLALVIAIWRRGQPDGPLAPARARNLATLLVLSVVWAFLVVFSWGL